MSQAQLSFQKQRELIEGFDCILEVDNRDGRGTHGGSGRDCSHRPGRLAQGVSEHDEGVYGLKER
jgi:hypothetical protein